MAVPAWRLNDIKCPVHGRFDMFFGGLDSDLRLRVLNFHILQLARGYNAHPGLYYSMSLARTDSASPQSAMAIA